MLRAGDPALPRAGDSSLPRHRQALRIQTAPPGLVFQNFGKSAHQFFMHARVRVAPPPNNSASSPRHQLLTCTRKNMVCQKRPMAPAAPPPQQLRPAAPPQRISQAPAAPPLLARARVGTTRRSAPAQLLPASLRRRNASCRRPRACAGGPRGCESRTNP